MTNAELSAFRYREEYSGMKDPHYLLAKYCRKQFKTEYRNGMKVTVKVTLSDEDRQAMEDAKQLCKEYEDKVLEYIKSQFIKYNTFAEYAEYLRSNQLEDHEMPLPCEMSDGQCRMDCVRYYECKTEQLEETKNHAEGEIKF